MLHAGFWGGLKEYYEKEYTGIIAGKFATIYAKELEDAGASFLDLDRPFDPDEIKTWIEDTRENFDPDEVEELFPSFFGYDNVVDEIASYFMWQDLEKFMKEIKDGNKEYTDEALRLNWEYMIEEIPNVKDVFLF